MKFLKKILVLGTLVLVGFSSVFANLNITNTSSNIEDNTTRKANTSSNNGTPTSKCIQLNTDIPGVGKCVEVDKAGDAFGRVMGALMRLMINFTVAIAFISLIAAGIMYSMSGVNQSVAGKGKDLLKKVILGIVLLGLSGLILHTINPNFFTTNIGFVLIKKL